MGATHQDKGAQAHNNGHKTRMVGCTHPTHSACSVRPFTIPSGGKKAYSLTGS